MPKPSETKSWNFESMVTCNIFESKLCDCFFFKARIRETKHLSTDANSSTNTRVGWTKNTPKRDFLKNKKIIQNAKTQKHLEICQNKRYTLWPEVSNPSGSVVSTMFYCTKNTKKTEKSSKMQKLKMSKNMPKLAIGHLTRSL